MSRRRECVARLGDAPLDIRPGSELGGLVDCLGREEGPGTGGDWQGEGLEVAERPPRRAGEAKAANLVSCVDAHGFLPF